MNSSERSCIYVSDREHIYVRVKSSPNFCTCYLWPRLGPPHGGIAIHCVLTVF